MTAAEDARLNDMLNKEVSDREAAISDLESRMNGQNDDRIQEIDDLRTKLMRENQFLRNLANKSNSVYFDAYRTKAYDGGGEENLTFQVRSEKSTLSYTLGTLGEAPSQYYLSCTACTCRSRTCAGGGQV